jgi:glycosyltransferase involved in cell wall biosynthesis
VHVLHCHRSLTARVDEVCDGVHVHRRPTLRFGWSKELRRSRVYRSLHWHVGHAVRGPNYPRDRLLGRLNMAMSMYTEYRRLGQRFDAVEAAESGAMAMIVSLVGSEPLVMQLHCPPVLDLLGLGEAKSRDRMAGALDRVPIVRADVRTPPSKLLMDEMSDLGYLSGVDYTVIPLPFRPDPEPALRPADEAAPIILGVGRIEPSKGWHALIEAAGSLHDVPSFEIVIAGGDVPGAGGKGYHDRLTARARALGVPLRFLGFVPHEEMAAHYAAARVVAMPSVVLENFSVTGIEALASGRPLVTTPQLGYAEDIVAAGAAYAVPPNDTRAFAAALRDVLVDPAKAAAMGTRGREWVLRALDPQRIAAQREGAYAEAIERRSRRRLTRARR